MGVQLGPNTTVTFTPTSPAGDPYTGVTDAEGRLHVEGVVYTWDSASGRYRYQQPGTPPGDWFAYDLGDGEPPEFNKYHYPKETGVEVWILTGTWGAVA